MASEPTEPLTRSAVANDRDDDLVANADVGRFRVVRHHARGGLGEVLVAEDTEVGRLIALKRIQERWADEPDSRSRFIREAEITGRLEHPGVVPVYGLGRDADGRPFYAMRFIRGNDLYAALCLYHVSSAPAAEKNVTFRDLLHRFVAVCQAVAYAHSRGVLHRDLKPANVMLGRFGETLVVDWGLAKIHGQTDEPITPASLRPVPADHDSQTVAGDRVGTPAYMSPEQAAGNNDAVGPASDIYSLGVTLYEILTGRLPIESRDVGEVLQLAVRGEWKPPRQVKADVPRPLDAVCRKAMARHPRQRYASADELADDVRRWLAGEPVGAWPEPWTWRLGRWLRRHRTVVFGFGVLAVTVLIALAVGLAAVDRERRRVVLQERETARQRDEARRQRLRTREALDQMTSQVSTDWLRSQKQLLPEQKRFLEKTLEYYREFAADAPDDAAGRRAVADAQSRVANMFQALGQRTEAETAFRQAIASYLALTTDFPSERHYREELAMAHNNLAVLLQDLGRHAEAEEQFRTSLARREANVRDFPDHLDGRRVLALSLSNRAVLCVEQSRFSEAEAAYRRAIELLDDLVRRQPDQLGLRHFLAGITMNYSILLASTQREGEAVAACDRAIEQFHELVRAKPNEPRYQRALADALSNQSISVMRQGRFDESIGLNRQALEMRERLAAAYPSVPDYRKGVGDNCNNLTMALNRAGRYAEAEAYSQRALTIREQLLREHPGVRRYLCDLASAERARGELLNKLNRPTEARPWFDRAIEQMRPVVETDPRLMFERDVLANAYSGRAIAAMLLQEWAVAIDDWDRALANWPELDSYRASWLTSRAAARLLHGDPAAALSGVDAAEALKVSEPESRVVAAAILAALASRITDPPDLRTRAATILAEVGTAHPNALTKFFRDRLHGELQNEPAVLELFWAMAES